MWIETKSKSISIFWELPERSFIKKKVFIYIFFVLIFCPSI